MRGWLIRMVALGLAGILVGVGVTMVIRDDGDLLPSGDREPPKVDPEPGADQPPEQALARFYDQDLDWRDCGRNECADLEVPLDYREPSGETIELALLRRPADEPDEFAGSLVVNPGGPGASGNAYAKAAPFGEALTDRFDIVGFDPRGTLGSSPIDCLDDDELDEYVASDPDPDSPAEGRAYSAGAREFAIGCVERSGEVAGHVSTVEVARDLDVLRAALGDARLDYFGASYGTKLGATYAELFPDRVGRLVLDGALDPTLSPRQLTLRQAEGFQTALEAYVANCLETGDPCFLGDSVEEGVARIEEFLDAVEEEPLPAGDRELRVGNAFYGLAAAMYSRSSWTVLSTALRQAFDGDGSTLMQFADLYVSRGPDGYTDNVIEANLAINCLDDPRSVPAPRVPRLYPAFDRASPVFGRAMAWAVSNCRGFEPRAVEPPPAVRAEGAPPILVIGTTRDPATPLVWARALAEQLESGVLMTRDGDGHTAYNSGSECVDEAVEAYLLDGEVPEDGLACS